MKGHEYDVRRGTEFQHVASHAPETILAAAANGVQIRHVGRDAAQIVVVIGEEHVLRPVIRKGVAEEQIHEHGTVTQFAQSGCSVPAAGDGDVALLGKAPAQNDNIHNRTPLKQARDQPGL